HRGCDRSVTGSGNERGVNGTSYKKENHTQCCGPFGRPHFPKRQVTRLDQKDVDEQENSARNKLPRVCQCLLPKVEESNGQQGRFQNVDEWNTKGELAQQAHSHNGLKPLHGRLAKWVARHLPRT